MSPVQTRRYWFNGQEVLFDEGLAPTLKEINEAATERFPGISLEKLNVGVMLKDDPESDPIIRLW